MQKPRRIKTRIKKIETLLYENGFISVEELSNLCDVSVATIRRDLQILVDENRIMRFHGGAKLISPKPTLPDLNFEHNVGNTSEFLNQLNALIVTSIDSESDEPLLQQFYKDGRPIIAESLPAKYGSTFVALDNYKAGFEIGIWAGEYAKKNWDGIANYLDLTYHISNTQERSRGFVNGLREVLPNAREMLSINAQSNYNLAYQLTSDALSVHKEINIIFAINDTCASGALKACQDLSVDPNSVIVIPFGLEGNTFRDLLSKGEYCKVALAMFPEIVGKVCVQAAIEATNGVSLPTQLITPYKVLTSKSMRDYYKYSNGKWEILWDSIESNLDLPLEITSKAEPKALPIKIGFTIRYRAHEWYQNLLAIMQEQSTLLNMEFNIIDIDQTLKDELNVRRYEIAQRAASEIQEGDTIIIDSGPISTHLAKAIIDIANITVITNNQLVIEILKGSPDIILMSTGGVVRRNDFAMVGPIAETVMRDLRADKLFLMVSGVTSDFGLSHDNLSEITIKRAMIESSREIILLADHMCFRSESVVRFSPLKTITKLITDEALPASFRLEIQKAGVQVCVA
ncbi:MAG: DeoR family transcriptional regulator [Anaerolineaceae bacterium]|nr:DeoR family transcriptional regulator [Anaerolineaceae bacterium]